MEANHLGQIRTGAASGYATDLMAGPEASILAVIGSGFHPFSGQKVAYVSAISLTDTSMPSAFSTASCKKRRSESLSVNRLSTVTW